MKIQKDLNPNESYLIGSVIDGLIEDRLGLEREKNPVNTIRKKDIDYASMFGVEASSFSTYRSSTRKPKPTKCDEMASSWTRIGNGPCSYTSQEIASLLKRSRTGETRTITSNTMLQKLRARPISTLQYMPFSGNNEQFIEKLFGGAFKEIPEINKFEPRTRYNIDDPQVRARHNILLSLFYTPGRSSYFRFWKMPIRFSLNALTTRSAFDRVRREWAVLHPKDPHGLIEHLRHGLTYGAAEISNQIEIKPILINREVGQIHMECKLGFRNHVPMDSLDPSGLAEALLQTSNSPKAANELPIVVADEYSILKTLALLKYNGLLLLPLTFADHSRRYISRRMMPQFFLSIAVNRNEDKDLWGFVQETLNSFLRSEPELVASELADLYFKLEDEMHQVARYLTPSNGPGNEMNDADRLRYIRQYCLYTTSMDERSLSINDVLEAPWPRILRRAKEIVQSRWFLCESEELEPLTRSGPKIGFAPALREMLKLDVASMDPSTSGSNDFSHGRQDIRLFDSNHTSLRMNILTSPRQIATLSDILDLQSAEEVHKLRGKTAAEILDRLPFLMLPPELRVISEDHEVWVYASFRGLNENRRNDLRSLLTQLKNYYLSHEMENKLGETQSRQHSAAGRVEEALQKLCGPTTQAADKAANQPVLDESVIFVMDFGKRELYRRLAEINKLRRVEIEDLQPEPIGVIILGAQDKSQDLKEGCAELRYLYVVPSKQKEGIGGMLISVACNLASQKGINCVYVEILPQLTQALSLYTSLGFDPWDIKSSVPGRQVMRKKLTEA